MDAHYQRLGLRHPDEADQRNGQHQGHQRQRAGDHPQTRRRVHLLPPNISANSRAAIHNPFRA
jgi:hypothetical protein